MSGTNQKLSNTAPLTPPWVEQQAGGHQTQNTSKAINTNQWPYNFTHFPLDSQIETGQQLPPTNQLAVPEVQVVGSPWEYIKKQPTIQSQATAVNENPKPIAVVPFTKIDIGQSTLSDWLQLIAGATLLAFDTTKNLTTKAFDMTSKQILNPIASLIGKDVKSNLNINSWQELVGLGANQQKVTNENILSNPQEQLLGYKIAKNENQQQQAAQLAQRIRTTAHSAKRQLSTHKNAIEANEAVQEVKSVIPARDPKSKRIRERIWGFKEVQSGQEITPNIISEFRQARKKDMEQSISAQPLRQPSAKRRRGLPPGVTESQPDQRESKATGQ